MNGAKKSRRRRESVLPQRSVFERLNAFGMTDAAVDLGSANTVVYIRGRGVVVREPSVLLVDDVSREVIAVGQAAAALEGAVPEGMHLLYPIRHGAVTDFEAATELLSRLVDPYLSGWRSRPRMLAVVGTGLTSVERRAVLETAAQVGTRKVVGIESPLAAAYGSDLEQATTPGLMVADIGADTTDLALVNAHGITHARWRCTGAAHWHHAVQRTVWRECGVRIGPRTAEQLTCQVGDLREGSTQQMECAGMSVQTGLPATVTVTADMLRPILRAAVASLVADAESLLVQCTPELSQWVRMHGMLLVGGGARLQGIAPYLTGQLGMPVYQAEDPLFTVVLGAGKSLTQMDYFRDSLGGA